jgi:hypothetical protein
MGEMPQGERGVRRSSASSGVLAAAASFAAPIAPVLETPFTPVQLPIAVRGVVDRRARSIGDSQA